MIKRRLYDSLRNSINRFPVVALLGPRQVGKTTLAKFLLNNIKKECIYLDLELLSDDKKLEEPELFLSHYQSKLVIIDEIQRRPELFSLFRALIDKNRISGRFLLLGSASSSLVKYSSETLAGRIKFLELLPFSYDEIKTYSSDFNNLWIKGGYPESFLAEDFENSFEWRTEFIRTFLEMDIPMLGIKLSTTMLRRFWSMIAHSHGQLWNASKIAASLGVTAPTAKHYLDILRDTFMIRQLSPYYSNMKKRLIKSPKCYFRDSGLLHNLLNIHSFEELMGNPIVGHSWEGFVIESIISILPKNFEYYFYRTQSGAEIDLLLISATGEKYAVEIKHSLSPKISKGFFIAFKDLTCKKGYIVYPGEEIYPIKENIFVFSFKNLQDLILEII